MGPSISTPGIHETAEGQANAFVATRRSAKTPGINVKPTPLLVISITTWLAQNMMAGEQAAKFPPFLYEVNGAQKIIRYGSEDKVVWGGGFRL